MKKVLAFIIALSFFFFFVPEVGAIADEGDASFWLNYWVEEHTGVDMTQIPTTAYGMSYADYIYRQTGYTVDYWVDNVSNPAMFAENTDEYLQNTYNNNSQLLKDLLSTTPIANTTSQTYSTQKTNKIDSDGGIDVSGDNYWHSVYNGLSTNKGYKDTYSNVSDNGVNGSYNGNSFSVSCIGLVKSSDGFYNEINNSPFTTVFQNITCYTSYGHLYQFGESLSNGYYGAVWQITVNGDSCYCSTGTWANTRSGITYNYDGYETTYYM